MQNFWRLKRPYDTWRTASVTSREMGDFVLVPQQRKLMGSSQVKVWETLVQSQVKSNRVPEKVPDVGDTTEAYFFLKF